MGEASTYITVSELTFAIKNHLESRFLSLTITGEISNAKLQSSGHFYFDLKDMGAKISVVMFRPQCQQLSRLPKEGDKVIIRGGLSVYPPHGKYQLLARSLEYMGAGELLLKREVLKQKLQSLGWFDKVHKQLLPKFPRTIGVVTSPTGAVIRDIIHILSRRCSGFHLILNPVRVQGVEAPYEIAKAIATFNTYHLADVLIVGRGGGSLEDLWAFNEECVARAIFESKIPIISAVGHETDVTIADFVADVRAPTPSAAAEIVSAERTHFLECLNKAKKTLDCALSNSIKNIRSQLKSFELHPLLAAPHTLLAIPVQRLDDLKLKVEAKMHDMVLKKRYRLSALQKQATALKPTAQLSLYRTTLQQIEKRMLDSTYQSLKLKKLKLNEVALGLKALDPKKVLKRGYSILFAEKEGSVIVSSHTLKPGTNLRALLSDGVAKLTVNSVND